MPTHSNRLLRAFVAVQVRLSQDTVRSERGAGLAEYALLLALIAVVTVTAIGGLRTAIIGAFNSATGQF